MTEMRLVKVACNHDVMSIDVENVGKKNPDQDKDHLVMGLQYEQITEAPAPSRLQPAVMPVMKSSGKVAYPYDPDKEFPPQDADSGWMAAYGGSGVLLLTMAVLILLFIALIALVYGFFLYCGGRRNEQQHHHLLQSPVHGVTYGGHPGPGPGVVYVGQKRGPAVHTHQRAQHSTLKQETKHVRHGTTDPTYAPSRDHPDATSCLDDTGWSETEFDSSTYYEEPVSTTGPPSAPNDAEKSNSVEKSKPRMGCSSFIRDKSPDTRTSPGMINEAGEPIYDNIYSFNPGERGQNMHSSPKVPPSINGRESGQSIQHLGHTSHSPGRRASGQNMHSSPKVPPSINGRESGQSIQHLGHTSHSPGRRASGQNMYSSSMRLGSVSMGPPGNQNNGSSEHLRTLKQSSCNSLGRATDGSAPGQAMEHPPPPQPSQKNSKESLGEPSRSHVDLLEHQKTAENVHPKSSKLSFGTDTELNRSTTLSLGSAGHSNQALVNLPSDQQRHDLANPRSFYKPSPPPQSLPYCTSPTQPRSPTKSPSRAPIMNTSPTRPRSPTKSPSRAPIMNSIGVSASTATTKSMPHALPNMFATARANERNHDIKVKSEWLNLERSGLKLAGRNADYQSMAQHTTQPLVPTIAQMNNSPSISRGSNRAGLYSSKATKSENLEFNIIWPRDILGSELEEEGKDSVNYVRNLITTSAGNVDYMRSEPPISEAAPKVKGHRTIVVRKGKEASDSEDTGTSTDTLTMDVDTQCENALRAAGINFDITDSESESTDDITTENSVVEMLKNKTCTHNRTKDKKQHHHHGSTEKQHHHHGHHHHHVSAEKKDRVLARRQQLLLKSKELFNKHKMTRKHPVSSQTGPSLDQLIKCIDGIGCQTGASLDECSDFGVPKITEDPLASTKPEDEVIPEEKRATISLSENLVPENRRVSMASHTHRIDDWVSKPREVRVIPQAPPQSQDGKFLSPWRSEQEDGKVDNSIDATAQKSQENRVLEIHIRRQRKASDKSGATEEDIEETRRVTNQLPRHQSITGRLAGGHIDLPDTNIFEIPDE
ncbi:hypothetical protein CAPTEDRAFT_190306 [Capitella teleta]|uniref:Uncharacterized protein n=1 Tax=Capitella teleta TaxID=283909 RepID=R7VBQ4_CAPTE|nr:hypothetical protein CAPTEDRAFT_190306 [Capitella teleta]|eukprot:ELU13721.1 hypothetical protein CAPTEDRAFT_190306 [Capitella teleta]